MPLFYIFQISLISGFIESSILISASTFNLLQCDAFIEVYKENPASHTYIVGGGWSILMAFFQIILDILL